MGSTVTLMFVDQVGSTAQLSSLGDARAHTVRQRLFDTLRQSLAAFDGREVDFTGDGLFASFDSAVQATDAGIDMQRW